MSTEMDLRTLMDFFKGNCKIESCKEEEDEGNERKGRQMYCNLKETPLKNRTVLETWNIVTTDMNVTNGHLTGLAIIK